MQAKTKGPTVAPSLLVRTADQCITDEDIEMESEAMPGSRLYVRGEQRRYRVANADEIIEAARAVAGQRMQRGESFTDPQASSRFLQDKLAGLEREVFAAVFLDTRHRLIEYVELFQGTIDGAEVHPREVVRHAIRCNAAAVIVAHNHPSGTTDPSAADRAVTARLKQALALVDVRLLDHIIVAGDSSLAMASRGWV
ncbi:RadC family protein [Thermomonas mangrovi]|uniref:RadC family protein n=1 Tax=Thermomonas mangrovi TaxID=2993316 RepID=UPI003CE5C660